MAPFSDRRPHGTGCVGAAPSPRLYPFDSIVQPSLCPPYALRMNTCLAVPPCPPLCRLANVDELSAVQQERPFHPSHAINAALMPLPTAPSSAGLMDVCVWEGNMGCCSRCRSHAEGFANLFSCSWASWINSLGLIMVRFILERCRILSSHWSEGVCYFL